MAAAETAATAAAADLLTAAESVVAASAASASTNPTLETVLTSEVKQEEPARKSRKLKSTQIALELPIRVRGFFE